MKRYILLVVVNVLIVLIGVFWVVQNPKTNIATLEQECLIPYLEDLYYSDSSDDAVFNTHKPCLSTYIITPDVHEQMTLQKASIMVTEPEIQLSSNDRFLTIDTTINYRNVDISIPITLSSYKYLGNHVPADLIIYLLIVLVNTSVYLFATSYDQRYQLHTMFNTAGGVLVIAALLTNSVAFAFPLYYSIVFLYVMILLVHLYVIFSTKKVRYQLKLEHDEMRLLDAQLETLQVPISVHQRVTFAGTYYMLKIDLNQIQGFETLMNQVLEPNKRLYFYINAALLAVMNIVALIYLIQYFLSI